MVLCKICGTVYDEFYGLCPKCGTPYEAEDAAPDSLPPIGKIAPPKENAPGALPSIEDALRSSGDTDNDATLPVGVSPIDPDATIPVSKPALDPDATVPLGVQNRTFSADPDATVPLTQPGRSFTPAPDATVPLGTPPIQPAAAVDTKSNTKEVVMPGNMARNSYGDNYDAPAAQAPVKAPAPKKKSSGKIIAIILIIAVILAGCGVGAYFLFIRPNMTPQVNVEELVSQGDKYYTEGKTDDAINSYSKAIETKPDDTQLYIKLADAYLKKGDKENAIKTLNNGYEKTKSEDIKKKLDDISGTGESPDDPDTMRNHARSLNMAVLNMYSAVTSGDLNSSSPSDKLNGVSPSKLPAAGAVSSDKENAANALTVADVITYSGMTEKITASNIGTLVYDGAQIYYGADHTGVQLAFTTTIGEIRGVTVEESSVPEPSEESSEPQVSVVIDPLVIEAELNSVCKDLYAGVVAGIYDQSTTADVLNGLSAAKLPKKGESAATRKKAAQALTVADAIAYGNIGSMVDGLNIIDYNYENGNITYRGKGTPMTLDTTLGDIMAPAAQPSEESSKPEESSSVDEPKYTAAYVGQWKSVFNTAVYSSKEIEEFKNQLNWDEFDILLSNAGTASAYSVKDNLTTIVGTGTWSSEGNIITVTIDGDAIQFTYTDGKLSTEVLADAVYFEKADGPAVDPQPSQTSEPSQTSQESSQTSIELPEVPSDAFGVICFEVPEDWDENNLSIRVYDYDGNKNESNARLTFYSDGVYTYTVSRYSSTNYLFNNPKFIILSTAKDSGKVVQTEEIYVARGSKLYAAEKQGRKYLLTEK